VHDGGGQRAGGETVDAGLRWGPPPEHRDDEGGEQRRVEV